MHVNYGKIEALQQYISTLDVAARHINVQSEMQEAVTAYRGVLMDGKALETETKFIDVGFLRELRDVFTNSHRIGEENDVLEGVRYIQLSDTLANDLAGKIDKVIMELSDDSTVC